MDEGFELGTPGGSTRREGERRRAKREQDILERHPRIGKVLVPLQAPPRSEEAWSTGAEGEEQLAASLARRCPGVLVLHDRRMPRSRANIDHIAVAPSGVHVIDAKRYRGKVEVRSPVFGEQRLFIAGRNQAKLVANMGRQVEDVRAALSATAPSVPVSGCFCFVNPEGPLASSGLPLVRTLKINDYALLYPKRLAKRLNAPGTLAEDEIRRVAATLADRLPPA